MSEILPPTTADPLRPAAAGGPLACPMPALTLWQPWASLIALGVKSIETRSWPAPPPLIGERIAIHAAARHPLIGPIGEWFSGPDALVRIGGTERHVHARRAIVATARLHACIPMEDLDAPSDEVATLEHGHVLYLRPTVDTEFAIETRRHEVPVVDVDRSDQVPYGDFAPGRWAWMLEDVEHLAEPVPAKGRQKVWRWQP